MSSREIASLTSKEHKNVLRVIRDLISDQILDAQIEPLKFKYRGQQFDYYELNKRDSLVVVARLSPEFTAKVVDRWQELEERLVKPVDPMVALNDPATMRGLLLNYSEKVINLESQVEEMKPAVEAFERIAAADGSLCLRDAAKTLQIRPIDLTNYLHSNGYIYRRAGNKNWIAYEESIKNGFLIHKFHVIQKEGGEEMISTQVRLTPKGINQLAKVV
jgi:phage antirepressor YoqD-like protein